MTNFGHIKTTHRFGRVSKRGRTAYLILCFEETLKFYGEDLRAWEWVLKELWEITSTLDIERWVSRICDASPEVVLPYATYQEMMKTIKELGCWYELSEEEFLYLRNLYQKKRPNFQVISSIFDKIYWVITDDWGDLEAPFSPDCLHNIDDVEAIMRGNHIPLPSNEFALKFIMDHRDKHYGQPFDGMRFSALNM